MAVTLGSATSAERFSAARGLLDYGFANYARVELPVVEGIEPIPVKHGIAQMVDVVCEPPGAVVVRIADKDAITQQADLLPELEAPVESGQTVGKVVVKVGESDLCEYRLVAAGSVERMTFFRALGILFSSLIRM